jgi:hypothetical protein
VNLDFNEYEGSPGGFENEGPGTFEMRNRAAGSPVSRNYDVLAPTGSGAGRVLYAEGQDGNTDLTIRTQVFDRSGGRWSNLEAEKRRDAYRTDVQVLESTSRSGDSALLAYEISFAAGMEVSAKDFAVRVASANGHGELYEWSFVTLGGMDDAPFDVSKVSQFKATDYSDLSGSKYFNADGSVRAGGISSDDPVACGVSMSQYLSGASATAAPSGGTVQRGWYAIDDWNARVKDGAEDVLTNPEAGGGRLAIDQSVTGGMLGLTDFETVRTFTVWFGYHDIGFDTDGDGFTATNSNQEASLRQISLGSSVPEPTSAVLLAGALAMALRRRRA